MLEKLLPSIFKKEKQKPNPQAPPEGRKNKEIKDLSSDFNLVNTTQRIHVVPKYAIKLVLIIRYFIVVMSVVFGVILIFNFAASTVINFQKNLQKQLILEVDSYADVEEIAKSIDAKTLAYKKFSNERNPLLFKTEFVLDNIGPNIELKSMQIDSSGFSISFLGNSALDFTNLIMTYLEKDMLSEIIIRSASLDKSKDRFNVVLDGNFK
ncbi:hypothetical protein K0B04_03440 [Patescibacteria group bacterium]|nr:hypothetical protein [Patescibacteria group bacterium]